MVIFLIIKFLENSTKIRKRIGKIETKNQYLANKDMKN